MAELPSKLFFRIGEVAGLVGVEPHVLRYWEREFRTIRPTKSAKGQRVYSRKDVENLLRVRDLLYRDGFTIAGAKKKLTRGGEPAPEVDATPDEAPSELVTAALADEAREPTATPAETVATVDVKSALLAIRSDVEEFLAELTSPPPGIGPRTARD